MTSEDVYLALTKSEDDLEHYGVPGMKWGVRKALNYASSKRKAIKRSMKKIANSMRKRKVKRDKKSAERKEKAEQRAQKDKEERENRGLYGKKSIQSNKALNKAVAKKWKREYAKRGTMSDDDLKKAIARIKLENEFREQINKAYKKDNSFQKDILKELIKQSPNIIEKVGKVYNDSAESKNKKDDNPNPSKKDAKK